MKFGVYRCLACVLFMISLSGCAIIGQNKDDVAQNNNEEVHHLGDLTEQAGTDLKDEDTPLVVEGDNITGYKQYEGTDWVINYPDNWVVNEDAEKFNISIKSPNFAKNMASIVVSTGTTDKNLEQFSAGFTSAIWDNDGYLKVQDIKLGNFDAKKLEYQLNKIDTPDIQGIEYIVVDESIDRAYIVNLSSDVNYYGNFESNYKDIITSFKLLEIEGNNSENTEVLNSDNLLEQGWNNSNIDNISNEDDISNEDNINNKDNISNKEDIINKGNSMNNVTAKNDTIQNTQDTNKDNVQSKHVDSLSDIDTHNIDSI